MFASGLITAALRTETLIWLTQKTARREGNGHGRQTGFFEDEPIIAAVKSEEQLTRAIASDCNIIFFLFGNICNISSLVQRVADAGKHSLVHADLVNGLAAKEIAADFIRSYTCADGIISTKPQLLRHAREVGLVTVLRVFVLDSMALDNIDKLRTACNPDLIELVPGIVPKVIQQVKSLYRTPIIAGGLIRDKEDTVSALSRRGDEHLHDLRGRVEGDGGELSRRRAERHYRERKR